MEPSDADLLRRHLRADADAFGRLVRRHVDMVYAAARRQTGDPALAEDVTQAVFLVLARKAASLATNPTLAGWLIVTTRNVSKTAMRSKFRRRKHEQAAAKAEGVAMNDPVVAAELGRVIDDALAKLPAADRDAVTLRLLEDLSFADVGVALNVSEEAARKRFDRAVVRLRSILTNKGLAITAAGLVSTSKAFAAVTAPPGLAIQIIAAPSASAGVLAQGVLKMMTIKKVAMVTAAVLAASTVTGGLVVWNGSAHPRAAAIAQAPPAAADDYYVGGQVDRPGAYSLNGRPVTLRQALLAAGVKQDAASVQVLRRTTDREQITTYPIADVLTGNRGEQPMRRDDQIQVLNTMFDNQPNIRSLATLLRVKDVARNVLFFEKLGFTKIWEEPANGGAPLRRASVRNGVLSIRLDGTAEPTPTGGIGIHIWIDGGIEGLTAYRNVLIEKQVTVGPIAPDISMRSFPVTTPDGYVLNFFSANP